MRVDSRRLKLIARPDTWTALAGDLAWHLQPACPSPTPRVNTDEPILVTWPTTYQHPGHAVFGDPIRSGLAALGAIRYEDIAQPYDGIILFTIDTGGGARRIALDCYDLTHVNTRCASSVDVYFKMQHLREGYDGAPNVVPGGYVSASRVLHQHWCHLRALHDTEAARVDVFGRFGLRFSADLRRRAVAIMSRDRRVSFVGGTTQTIHSRYLREMARARICLDLPGQGPFCYRLVECLAMGCCIIGPPHATSLPVPLEPGVHLAYCHPDLHDLADLCAKFVADEEARRAIGRAAARYYDDHLHPVRLAEHYVRPTGALQASAL